jgi:hypothetical protein
MRRLAVTAIVGTAAAASAHAAGDWQTTLQARDINGDGTVDAYYDTSLNVTWLAIVNAGAGSEGDLVRTNDTKPYVSTDPSSPTRYGVAVPYQYLGPSGSTSTRYAYGDGLMTLYAGNTWASSLNVYGVTGWRLPSVTDVGSAGCVQGEADCGANPDVSKSELAHLYYVTLGNQAAGPNDTIEPNLGPFRRNPLSLDITATLRSRLFLLNNPAFAFNTLNGYQIASAANAELSAWAVRSGDVPSVPEGGTFGLMALGLLALSQVRRLRSR